jgi:hypothetical protein
VSGNPAGGLLLLLIAIFLLVQFFAGNLDWLFNLKTAVDTASSGGQPAGPAGPTPGQMSLLPQPGRVSSGDF